MRKFVKQAVCAGNNPLVNSSLLQIFNLYSNALCVCRRIHDITYKTTTYN